ncbi:MAG: Hsp20/alpha crystallin family protein [Chloroflexi bacterium]|nr:Hsp20/alpha crystallin family protein [Chloroflexota bacterium]
MANETTDLQVQQAEKQEIEESGAERTRSRLAFVPRTDIYETDESITLVADMPGVSADTVDVSLENDVLRINGLVEPQPPEGYHLAYAEYRVGDFQRSFSVSDKVDLDNVEATVKDGVLRLVMPKTQPRSLKVSVKTG